MRRRTIVWAVAWLMLAECAPVSSPLRHRSADADRPPATLVDAAIENTARPMQQPTDVAPELGASSNSPFHVVVVNKDWDDFAVSELHIRPIQGVTWLCGMVLFVVEGGAIEHARKLEAGLPTGANGEIDGLVEDVVGRWPDDAWLLFNRLDVSSLTHSVYRWRGNRWVPALPPFSSFGPPSLRSWGRGGVLVVERQPMPSQRIADKDLGPEPDLFLGLGARAGWLLRPAPLPHCTSRPYIRAVTPLANGSLIAALVCPLEAADSIARWSSPQSSAKPETLPTNTDAGRTVIDVEGISGDDQDDVRVFGGVEYGVHSPSNIDPYQAYIAHFDGKGWSEETAPPGAHSIGAYIRDAGGSSWAIDNSNRRSELWRRQSNGPWTAVVLPGIADVPAAYDPVTLTMAEDGTVWVWCRIRAGESVYKPSAALLSTLAPSRVVELEKLF